MMLYQCELCRSDGTHENIVHSTINPRYLAIVEGPNVEYADDEAGVQKLRDRSEVIDVFARVGSAVHIDGNAFLLFVEVAT